MNNPAVPYLEDLGILPRDEKFNPHHDRLGRFAVGRGNAGPPLSHAEAVGPVRARCDAVEEKIRNLSTERLVCINGTTGDIISTINGDENRVGIPDSKFSKFTGQIITHNHPSDGPTALSVDDIALAAGLQLKEMRAVGTDEKGRTHYYTVKPAAGRTWPSPLAVKHSWMSSRDRIMRTFANERNYGRSANEATDVAVRSWIEGLSPSLGIVYTHGVRSYGG